MERWVAPGTMTCSPCEESWIRSFCNLWCCAFIWSAVMPPNFALTAHAVFGGDDDQGRITQRARHFRLRSKIAAVLGKLGQHGFMVFGLAGNGYEGIEIFSGQRFGCAPQAHLGQPLCPGPAARRIFSRRTPIAAWLTILSRSGKASYCVHMRRNRPGSRRRLLPDGTRRRCGPAARQRNAQPRRMAAGGPACPARLSIHPPGWQACAGSGWRSLHP